MGLSLWNLYEAALLVLNAIAILHEERFLAKGMPFCRHSSFHASTHILLMSLQLDGVRIRCRYSIRDSGMYHRIRE